MTSAATVLFWMGQEPGHVFPTFPLAKQLQAAGCVVVYGVSAGMTSYVVDQGLLEVDYLGGFIDVAPLPDNNGFALEQSLRSLCSTEDVYLRCLETSLMLAIEKCRPKLIILDGIKDWRLIRGNRTFLNSLPSAVVRVCTHLRIVERWEMQNDLPRLLILCAPDFELPEARQDELTYSEVSSCLTELRPLPIKTSRHSCPSIYVTFGSQISSYPAIAGILDSILDAAQGNPQWLFSVDVRLLHLIPNRPLANVKGVPINGFKAELALSDVCICHGGMGTLRDCIYNSIPVLTIPQMWDQDSNSRRVARHGLGRSLSGDQVNAVKLTLHLQELMRDTSVASAIQMMRSRFLENAKTGQAKKLCLDAMLNRG